MDEELQSTVTDRIEGYLDAIEASADTAGEFVVEQAPLVAQEYLAWEFWSGAIAAALCLVVVLVYAATIGRIYRRIASRGSCTSDIDAGMVSGLITCFVPIPAVVVGVMATFGAVKVCIAPRLVLLEKVADLLP